ncbi:hypothetical protein [Natronomonas amylolytica]|uniref:DUF5789 family protein n=1 Tax=Natronomonas amylolytica TaxID=3108498 RepID=UPI00300A2053
MGVRPPQQSDDTEPEAVAFGIAALDVHLEEADVAFPITREALLEAVGNPEIPYDVAGDTITLERALDETHHQRFETRQELLNALHPVFEAKRERASKTVIGRLRSMLPF